PGPYLPQPDTPLLQVRVRAVCQVRPGEQAQAVRMHCGAEQQSIDAPVQRLHPPTIRAKQVSGRVMRPDTGSLGLAASAGALARAAAAVTRAAHQLRDHGARLDDGDVEIEVGVTRD